MTIQPASENLKSYCFDASITVHNSLLLSVFVLFCLCTGSHHSLIDLVSDKDDGVKESFGNAEREEQYV